MSKQAPRIDPRLIAALGRLDDTSRPIAETSRQAGALAETLGLVRPSYEQIRVHVYAERRRAEQQRRRTHLARDVYVGRRPPRALFEPGE